MEAKTIAAGAQAELLQALIAVGAVQMQEAAPVAAPGVSLSWVPAVPGEPARVVLGLDESTFDSAARAAVWSALANVIDPSDQPLRVFWGAATPDLVPARVPARLAKLVLLGSGWLGPQVTTVVQMDAAIIAVIEALVPAGLQREAAKLAWLTSTVFEKENATLLAMLQALGKTADDRDALFIQADTMRRQELAAQGVVAGG